MIEYKSEREIAIMAKAGLIAAKLFEKLEELIVPGITTNELDLFAEKFIRSQGAEPAFKGYRGYPKTLCTSINEEVVHGIPSERSLKEGDLISIDLGARLEGYYSDTAKTFAVGNISKVAKELIETTKKALYRGIDQIKIGARLSDISHAIEVAVKEQPFGVVKQFVGHGIGAQLHEEPQIPNYGSPGEGPVLKEGMVLAIEPMVTEGNFEVEILEDGWTAVTKDRKLAAHFEHTVAVTKDGPKILTQI